jgi:hypothetical protein
MNAREKVLKEALDCINGERENQYGNSEDNFAKIAEFWGLYLTTLFEGTGVVVELDPKDVAMMMILFKIARSSGDQDKLDDYVDIIRYAACGAEILEERKTKTNADLESKTTESRTCSKKASSNIKDLLKKSDPYLDYLDALAYYVSVKAKEKCIVLNHLKNINWEFKEELEKLLDKEATDCAINGKKLFDCYGEIDKLLEKYADKSENIDKSEAKENSPLMPYDAILSYIITSSKKSNIDQCDLIRYLTEIGHAPTSMAFLLIDGKISFDDVTAYIDDAASKLGGIRRINKDE